jgi:hypothetical protein
MRCEDIRDQLFDVAADDLRSADPDVIAHVESCRDCQATLARARRAWSGLGVIPDEPADSPAMRQRFDALLRAEARHRTVRWPARGPAWGSLAAAAALVLAIGLGVLIGRQWPGHGGADDMTAMRQQLADVREMLTESLLQQSAASARIRGVGAAGQLQDPRAELLGSIVDALTHDPDVNVRLAALRTLDRFHERPAVQQGVVRALAREDSPLVTIALIDFVVDTRNGLAIDTLRDLARDPSRDAEVRESAARGADELGGQGGV